MVIGPYDPCEYLTVNVSVRDAVTVMEVSGEIDLATSEVMAERVLDHLDATPADLVLDLSKVEFMGSVGLAVLIETYQRCQQYGTTLAIVAPEGCVAARVLTVSGMGELLPVYRSVSEALHASSRQRERSPVTLRRTHDITRDPRTVV